MKIEFLNAWRGSLTEPITRHLEQQVSEIDIFCFQEASPQMQRICEDALPDHTRVTARKRVLGNPRFQQATYVHSEIELKGISTILNETEAGGFGLVVAVKSKTEPLLQICNFHGVSQPGDKLDTPERIHQSQVVVDFFRKHKVPSIIGGDFNALPDTRSILMLEEEGYQNLIKDFQIKSTRNRLAWELYPDSKQHFADYVFASPGIEVVSFSVPEEEVSDHLPMIVSLTV